MTLDHILASIDDEIAALQKVSLLNGKPAREPAALTAPKKRRKLSAEARKRIADAQKTRWAAQKAEGK